MRLPPGKAVLVLGMQVQEGQQISGYLRPRIGSKAGGTDLISLNISPNLSEFNVARLTEGSPMDC